MNKARLIPLGDITDDLGNFTGYSVDEDGVIVNTSDCPFPFFDEPQFPEHGLYKIINDGGHYVATPYFHSYGKRPSDKTPFEKVFDMLYYSAFQRQRKWERNNDRPLGKFNANYFIKKYLSVLRARFPSHKLSEKRVRKMIKAKRDVFKAEKKITKTQAIDVAFNSLYRYAVKSGLSGEDLSENVKTGLSALNFGGDLDKYVADKIERQHRNMFARKKRFRRKGYLNTWTHFVTLTYDDEKQTAETFRKKLRKCLSNLHTRRGWKYMGVFEESPETGRLHFHGLFYIPEGEMVGRIVERRDYSTKQGKMMIRHESEFFADSLGRNDFEEITMEELRHGKTLEYILKYIEKTGERVVYSRGIPSQVCKVLPAREIVGRLQDFMTKYVLFDDTIDWKRDVMRFNTQVKQMTVIDVLCNPPRVA